MHLDSIYLKATCRGDSNCGQRERDRERERQERVPRVSPAAAADAVESEARAAACGVPACGDLCRAVPGERRQKDVRARDPGAI